MTGRTGLDAEKYLASHNIALAEHPRYRADMKFTSVDAFGNLVVDTRDETLSTEDSQVFQDVQTRVAQTYKLIVL